MGNVGNIMGNRVGSVPIQIGQNHFDSLNAFLSGFLCCSVVNYQFSCQI